MEFLEGVRITQGEKLTHLMMGIFACFIAFSYLKADYLVYLAIASHFGTFLS